MLSESSISDKTIHELAGEKKVGDETKEEEKHDPEDVFVTDKITKEAKHEQVGQKDSSLIECQLSSSLEPAIETKEGKSNIVEIFTSAISSKFKQEYLEDVEALPASENDSLPEEAPLLSSVEAEIQETIDLEAPVENLEVESGFSVEKKLKGNAETEVYSELIKPDNVLDEEQVLDTTQVPADASESPKNTDVDLITSKQVPLNCEEIDSGTHEEKKLVESTETKEHTELIKSEVLGEVQELVLAKTSNNFSEAPEKGDIDSNTPITIEVPIVQLRAECGSPEEQKSEESLENKPDIELIKSEDSKDGAQESVPSKVLINKFEVPEKTGFDFSAPTITDAPGKNVEDVSGSLKVQKQEECSKTKEPNSDAATLKVGGGVAGSTSYEKKTSGAAEVVEKNEEDFRNEVIQTKIKSLMTLENRSKEAQTLSDGGIFSEEVSVKKDDGFVEDCIDPSGLLVVVSSVAKASYEDEMISGPGEVATERKNVASNGDNNKTVPKVFEVSLAGGEAKKYVDMEKDVNVEAVGLSLAETAIDSTAVDVSTELVKSHENVEEHLEATSKELDASSEFSEIPSEGERVGAGLVKTESLKDEDATIVKTPEGITTSNQSHDQLVKKMEEKENESSKSVTNSYVEPSREAVKEVTSSETYQEMKVGISKDLSLKELNESILKDKTYAVEAEGAIENATDNPESERLEVEKEQKDQLKDREAIVSSATMASATMSSATTVSATTESKSVKGVIKRQSNIFAKLKRSVIKVKKAILGKSTSPKAVTSEAKYDTPN